MIPLSKTSQVAERLLSYRGRIVWPGIPISILTQYSAPLYTENFRVPNFFWNNLSLKRMVWIYLMK
jgi:hypothetical protein